MTSRETKKNILDKMEAWCCISNISKKTIGIIIRSLHISSPYVFMIFIMYGSQMLIIVSYIFLICVFFCFILNNGCLLTMLEHRLCGDNFTIADPLIEYYGMEMTSSNRMNISFILGLSFFIIYTIIYYYRFYI
jgi:hypothetical protein